MTNKQLALYMFNARKLKASAWKQFERHAMCPHCEVPGTCCQHLISVSRMEALVISHQYHELCSQNSKRFVECFEAELGSKFDPHEYSKGKHRCLFLDDQNRCEIYQDRPMSCMAHALAKAPGVDSTICLVDDAVVPLLATVPISLLWHAELEKPELPEFYPGLAAGIWSVALDIAGEHEYKIPTMKMTQEGVEQLTELCRNGSRPVAKPSNIIQLPTNRRGPTCR